MNKILLTIIAVLVSEIACGEINPIKVYSMVWSGKHYIKAVEKKDFFFAIPMSFKTQMNLDQAFKKITLKFDSNIKDSNYLVLKTEVENLNKSKFEKIVTFSDDRLTAVLNLDFSSNPEYELSLSKEYGNKTFKSYKIKISIPSEKNPHAFYITFDLAFGETTDIQRDGLSNFLNSIKK